MSDNKRQTTTDNETNDVLLSSEDAAQYVNQSVKTLERARNAGKLSSVVMKLSSDTRKKLYFRKAELDVFKASLETPKIQQATIGDNGRQSLSPIVQRNEQNAPVVSSMMETLSKSLETIANKLTTTDNDRQEVSLSDLNQKSVLTVNEAVKISGLPKGRILKAIQTYRVPSIKDSDKRHLIRRVDLDVIINLVFEGQI